MQRSSNPVYPLSEAIEILTSDSPPKHIHILTKSLDETRLIIKLAKTLNYISASTTWTNVIELLKVEYD